MFVIGIHTFTCFVPVLLVAGHFPAVQNTEKPVGLMPQRPKVSTFFRIDSEWDCLNLRRAVNGILMLEAVLSHQLSVVERSLISSEQIVNVHCSRINIFQIRAL